MTKTSPNVLRYPAVCANKSPFRSLTITLCCQVNNWLVANNPFPPLVGATISIFPSSRRVLVGRASRKCFQRFTPMSKLVGSGGRDRILVSSSSLAKRALWSRLSKPQIRKCTIFSISVAIPIVPPVPSVSAFAAQDHALVFALTLLRLPFVSMLGSLVPATVLAQQPQYAHADVGHDRYARLRPIAPLCEVGLLSRAWFAR